VTPIYKRNFEVSGGTRVESPPSDFCTYVVLEHVASFALKETRCRHSFYLRMADRLGSPNTIELEWLAVNRDIRSLDDPTIQIAGQEVLGVSLRPRLLDHAEESARQLTDAILLAKLQRLLG
jgi:hypothetical protein